MPCSVHHTGDFQIPVCVQSHRRCQRFGPAGVVGLGSLTQKTIEDKDLSANGLLGGDPRK